MPRYLLFAIRDVFRPRGGWGDFLCAVQCPHDGWRALELRLKDEPLPQAAHLVDLESLTIVAQWHWLRGCSGLWEVIPYRPQGTS